MASRSPSRSSPASPPREAPPGLSGVNDADRRFLIDMLGHIARVDDAVAAGRGAADVDDLTRVRAGRVLAAHRARIGALRELSARLGVAERGHASPPQASAGGESGDRPAGFWPVRWLIEIHTEALELCRRELSQGGDRAVRRLARQAAAEHDAQIRALQASGLRSEEAPGRVASDAT
jgi:hypothetical protein